jgi:hypothetical protein
MKQQILNLKKKLLLVELPEGAITNNRYVATICQVPKDTCNLIGKLTDITEQQFADFVSMHKSSNDTWRYANYKNLSGQWFDTAKESFFSYLEANGVLFKNHLGDKPVRMVPFMGKGRYTIHQSDLLDEYHKSLKRWQEAEQKVWNRGQTYLFQIL